jgi:hypothetical protein
VKSPGELGLDHGRLKKLDQYFARYVDDGELAGWQLAITRHGEIALRVAVPGA